MPQASPSAGKCDAHHVKEEEGENFPKARKAQLQAGAFDAPGAL